MQFFYDLGAAVERRWIDCDYDESAFPDIAAEALAEADAVGRVSPWEIVLHLHTSASLPKQQEHDFSDLPLTVYRGPRFSIEVYYWLDGTTTLHQHGFSGAFQVLAGSSIHSRYSFERERKINAHFSTGDIVLQDVRLLETGAVSRILPGRSFIHSLFHLDRPSVTLTVRTYTDPGAQPQYDYLAPHVAVDPFYTDHLILRKMQSAVLLLRMEHPEADSLIAELISRADFQTTFSVLKEAYKILTGGLPGSPRDPSEGRARFGRLVEAARRRHGELVSLALPSLEELERKKRLVERRARVTDREHRFFLALLLNVPQRGPLLELVRQRFPEREPVETVCRWVEELSGVRATQGGKPGGDGNAKFSPVQAAVLRHMLEGLSQDELRGALADEFGADYERDLRQEVEGLQEFFRNSILKPILFGPSGAGGGGAQLERQAAG